MNGKIYMIKSPQTNMCYIGSTKQTLEKRLKQHCNAYNVHNADKPYCTAYEVIKYENPYIMLIEEVVDVTKKELNRKEGEYIKNTANCVNVRIPGRTSHEHYIDNYDTIMEYKKAYRETHKDKIKEYDDSCKEKKKIYAKEYRQINKDTIKVSAYNYRQTHKKQK